MIRRLASSYKPTSTSSLIVGRSDCLLRRPEIDIYLKSKHYLSAQIPLKAVSPISFDMPAPLTLPVISISPYLPSHHAEYSESDRLKVAQDLHRACRDIGFFYLKVDDYLTDTERRAVLEGGREFFLQSTEDEKAAIGLEHGDGARGE